VVTIEREWKITGCDVVCHNHRYRLIIGKARTGLLINVSSVNGAPFYLSFKASFDATASTVENEAMMRFIAAVTAPLGF